MVKIDNRASGQLRCLCTILERGTNELPDEVWERLREHPFIEARLGVVIFEIAESPEQQQQQPPATRKSKKGGSKKPVQTDW